MRCGFGGYSRRLMPKITRQTPLALSLASRNMSADGPFRFGYSATRTPTVRTDGFYVSGPVEWEDWHAGVHMRETHYHFWRFYPDGNWVCCHRYDPAFAFWLFTESL